MADIHAERRQPAPPEGPLDLQSAGDDLLEEAAGMSSGRASRTLTPGAHAPLKQTLIALRSGVRLSEHEVNGPATIHLLRGAATINSNEGPLSLDEGQFAIIPPVRHDLHAAKDTVALITVAPLGEPGD